MKKIKIVTLGDHPLVMSGVGIQTRYFIEGMLKTGKYEFISLAGATKHASMDTIITEEYGEDWKIIPVDEYGNPELIRGMIRSEKPDMMWIMTDPRFWEWLWSMEDEIRPLIPIVYYHVWDNYPYPMFNKKFYDSNDVIATISKVTSDIVQTVSPGVYETYIPHAVDPDIYRKHSSMDVKRFKKEHFGSEDAFLFFWNNRNARRKQSGTLVWWFNEFLKTQPADKDIRLIMHTDPKDVYGTDLEKVIKDAKVPDGRVLLSPGKYPPEQMALLYNSVDCTINISDAEGFGLATLESLSCGTPILATMTGGLQEQVMDEDENMYGFGLIPASKSVIGSQQVPYIYEDRVSKEAFIDAITEMYEMDPKEREEMGQRGREHTLRNYNLEKNMQKWDELLTMIYEEHGSWDTRKNYKSWELIEV
jgi:glycosyltransferase involved in cell wall biosynthesis